MYYLASGTVDVPDDNWHLAMEAHAVRAELHPEVVAPHNESLYCNQDLAPAIGETDLCEVPSRFVHFSPVQNLIMVEMDFEEIDDYYSSLFDNEEVEYDQDELVFACFRPGQGHKKAVFILPLDKYTVRNNEEICLSQIRYIMHIAEQRLK